MRRILGAKREPKPVVTTLAGVGSEGYMALRRGRKFIGIELKRSYFEQAKRNLARAKEGQTMPLFEALSI